MSPDSPAVLAPELGGYITVGGAGVGVAAVGTGVYSSGAINPLSNWMFMSAPGQQSGSYTIDFQSGKQYFGKGPLSRAVQSAAEKAAANNDPAHQSTGNRR